MEFRFVFLYGSSSVSAHQLHVALVTTVNPTGQCQAIKPLVQGKKLRLAEKAEGTRMGTQSGLPSTP
jgi:hypothetical protein